MARVHSAFCGALISSRIVSRAGLAEELRITTWTDWGPKIRSVVPFQLDVRRPEDVLSTASFAEIVDLPPGIDLLTYGNILDTLGEIMETHDYLAIYYPKFEMFNFSNLDELAMTAVLILGCDTNPELMRLRRIQALVNSYGRLRGWLLRDYHDVQERNLHQKLYAMAGVSRVIVIEDSHSGGHLVEMDKLVAMTTPIVVLRAEGFASSWMADPFFSLQHVRLFMYNDSDATALEHASNQGMSWSLEFLQKRASALDQRYPWRQKEISLADRLFPAKW
jgi:hypothetical protein